MIKTHTHTQPVQSLPTRGRWDHLEAHRAWQPQFHRTLIFSSKCLGENPFTNPGMYLLWISGFDISPMWMSLRLNCLKSASSALHSMYYSPLFAKWSLYRLYIIHFVPWQRQGQIYLDSFSTATNINMYYWGKPFRIPLYLFFTERTCQSWWQQKTAICT